MHREVPESELVELGQAWLRSREISLRHRRFRSRLVPQLIEFSIKEAPANGVRRDSDGGVEALVFIGEQRSVPKPAGMIP